MKSANVFHLIMVVVAGVIIADLIAHVAGTTALFSGLNTLFTIGTQPVNTKAIKSTSVTNNTGSMKV